MKLANKELKYSLIKDHITGTGRLLEYEKVGLSTKPIALIEGEFFNGKLHGFGRIYNFKTETTKIGFW